MSGWITDKVKAAWNVIKSEFSGVETAAGTELTALEAEYLPAFHAFSQTSLSTLTTQGLTILKEETATIAQVFLSGGNVSVAIAASVPKVLAEVKTDVQADIAAAKNAVYTAVGLKLAALAAPTPATTAAASQAA